MIISKTFPIAIGSRRIVKKFAIYKTIEIGIRHSLNIEYVKLLFHSYYVLEEMTNTILGEQWYPIEYSLTENDFKSPPYKDPFSNWKAKGT